MIKHLCRNGHDITIGRVGNGDCKQCRSNRVSLWMKDHPETQALVSLKVRCNRVGITIEQYNALPKKCSFPECGAIEPGGRGDWHLDHNKVTGKFRGLLCFTHNRRVGDLTYKESLLVTEYLKRD